jgi:hypothetical protein
VIEALLKAMDRVIELSRIREKRFKTRFEEIHKPTFEDLKSVHSDYLLMFTELDQLLRAGRRQPMIVPDVLNSGIEILSNKRVVFEPVREKLLAFMDTFDDPQWQKPLSETEMLFIDSVREYMLANQQPFWGECYGPMSASTSLLQGLQRAKNGRLGFGIWPVCDILDGICERLRLQWRDVSICFLKLKLELANHRTS